MFLHRPLDILNSVEILLVFLLQQYWIQRIDVDDLPGVDGMLNVFRQIVGNELGGSVASEGFEFGERAFGGFEWLRGCCAEVYYLLWEFLG